MDSELQPMARATDPFTSKQAARTVNKDRVRRKILHFLFENDGAFNAWEIAQGIEEKETSVSSQMHHLCDDGLAHEVGMAPSAETGKDRITYAHGPGPNWRGKQHRMPKVQTGPRKLKFKPFTEDEIVEMGKKAGKYADIFTTLLNFEIEARLRG